MKRLVLLLVFLSLSLIASASPGEGRVGQVSRFAHGSAENERFTPAWPFPALAGCAVTGAVACAAILFLRRQVRRNYEEMIRHASDRLRIEETLFFVNESGSRYREDQLLSGIMEYLCACLEVHYAFVAQLLPDAGTARMLGYCSRTGSLRELEYDLRGTPCETVAGSGFSIYHEGVGPHFPDDGRLTELGVEGYAAVLVRNSRGEGVGVLGILSIGALPRNPIIETVLNIAGSRVAQELEAMVHLADLNLKNFTMESLTDAVYWVAPDARIWYANGAAAQMLGYSKEELLSMSVSDLNPEHGPEQWLPWWEELKEIGSLRLETVHITKSGNAIPVDIAANHISFKGTEYSCAIVRDITERRRMEQMLEHRLAVLTEPVTNLSRITVEDLFDLDELQEIQDAFAQATGVASIITDAFGHPITRPSNFCSLCNDIIRKTELGLANCIRSDAALGNNASEPTMQPCLSSGLWDGGAAIHVGGHHIGNWLVGQVLDESYDLEKMLWYADEIGVDRETYRSALSEVTCMPRERFEKICQALFQIAGQLSSLAIQNVQQAQHIAERKRVEELLLEYRKVIECSQDQICVVDRDYRYRLANGAFLDYRQLQHDQVVGQHAAEVLGDKLFATLRPHIDACLAGAAVSFEIRNDYPGKGVRSLAVSYNPIEDSSGSIRVACVMRDLTEKKHLEEQLRQSQKMEAIGYLAGGIAHDFNNILTVIVGYGNFLDMEGNLSAKQKEQVEQIVAASEKGAQLTRGLLAFSRKQIMDPHMVDLNSLVHQIQKFLLRIIGEDIRLLFTPHPDVLNVWADGSQLEQILMNLATNARDAMPAGGVLSIETCCQDVDVPYASSQGSVQAGRYACIMVSDDGEGMDSTTRERIFEPFFSTKVVGKGTGLGMSIVYGIVKQHKGFINVYSEPGTGTTFKIYLPLAEEVTETEVQACTPQVPVGGHETILVAEDDEGVRRLVQSLLARYGYDVIVAVDGIDCVEKYVANRDRIGLVLMDVIMPGKNGKEAFDEIRALAPAARVLFSSGYTADIVKNRAGFHESVDLIMKPVQPLALLKKVREVLDRAPADGLRPPGGRGLTFSHLPPSRPERVRPQAGEG